MSEVNRDAYTPTTAETARLRRARDLAVPPADEHAADYPIPPLSPERRVPNLDGNSEDRWRASTASTSVRQWTGTRDSRAMREINALIAEATKRTRPTGRVEITSGGPVMAPALDPALDTDEDF